MHRLLVHFQVITLARQRLFVSYTINTVSIVLCVMGGKLACVDATVIGIYLWEIIKKSREVRMRIRGPNSRLQEHLDEHVAENFRSEVQDLKKSKQLEVSDGIVSHYIQFLLIYLPHGNGHDVYKICSVLCRCPSALVFLKLHICHTFFIGLILMIYFGKNLFVVVFIKFSVYQHTCNYMFIFFVHCYCLRSNRNF